MFDFIKMIGRKQDVSLKTKKEGQAFCPNCNSALNKKPGRKTKCSHCAKDMYVRNAQHIFDSKLLTKEQAYVVDAIKQNECNGLSQDEMRKRLKSRPTERPSDVLWAYFQEKNLEGAKRGDWQYLKILNYSMALYLNKEGRSHNHCLEIAAHYELQDYLQSGYVQNVKIIAAPDSCEACKSQENRVLSVEKAMKEMPIPCKACTRLMDNQKYPFCRCLYVADSY